jgi:arylsulfatase B
MLLGLLLLFQASPAVPRDVPPDIVLIVLDDVAASDVDVVPTPNIDWIASQGVSFRRGYAAPTCVPSRFALMFGQYSRSGGGDSCRNRQPEAPSFAQSSIPKLLKARGYSTAAFGKWHLGSNAVGAWEMTAHLHGFDAFRAGAPANLQLCGGSGYNDWVRVDDGVSATTQEYQTTAVRDAFLSWWPSAPGPRFAYVCFQAAHVPLHVPPASILPPGYPTPITEREKYDAMLVSADWVIGEMLNVVDLRRTWIIVLGDNGTPPQALRPGQVTAKVKGSSFEDGVRVPFVVAGPGITRSFETQALVHVVDLLASVVELAGGTVPAGSATESISFVPCLRGPDVRTRSWVFCDWDPEIPPNVAKPPKHDRALVTQRYKLRRVGNDPSNTFEEIYDLVRDPTEIHPIDPNSPDVAPIVEGLRRQLNAVE